jgi:lysozyme
MKQRAAAVGGVVVVTASLTAFITLREGDVLTPYRDIGDVWTVCAGVTGPQVVPGKKYTRAECAELNGAAIEQHGWDLLKCMRGAQWTQRRYEALASLTYNVGATAVCSSGLPKYAALGDLIRSNRWPEACERILEYGKVKINGVRQSCSDPQWNCRGVWIRRKAERDMCAGDSAPPSLGVIG